MNFNQISTFHMLVKGLRKGERSYGRQIMQSLELK